TLLKCLMGVLPVAKGNVSFEGQDITRLKPHQRAKLGIAYVPQGREIFARLTVEENMLMGMATLSGRRASTIKGEVYELFPVLKEMLEGLGARVSEELAAFEPEAGAYGGGHHHHGDDHHHNPLAPIPLRQKIHRPGDKKEEG
ncbi:UNVERIFIED_CONTAM: ATP-binding cassette domain-containing protein, partial [Streptococcus suis]